MMAEKFISKNLMAKPVRVGGFLCSHRYWTKSMGFEEVKAA
jgi:hypothetical protein